MLCKNPRRFHLSSASLNLLKLHAIPKNFTNLKLFTIDFMSEIYQDLGDIHLYVYLYRPIRIVIHHESIYLTTISPSIPILNHQTNLLSGAIYIYTCYTQTSLYLSSLSYIVIHHKCSYRSRIQPSIPILNPTYTQTS